MCTTFLKHFLLSFFVFISLNLLAQPQKISGFLFLCHQDQPIEGEFQVYKKTGLLLKDGKFYKNQKYAQFISVDETTIIEGVCSANQQTPSAAKLPTSNNNSKSLDKSTAESILTKTFKEFLLAATRGDISLKSINLINITSIGGNTKKVATTITMQTTKDVVLTGKDNNSPCIPCLNVTQHLAFDMASDAGVKNLLRSYFLASKNTQLIYTTDMHFEFDEISNSWKLKPSNSQIQDFGYSIPRLTLLNPGRNPQQINNIITGKTHANKRTQSVVSTGEPVSNPKNSYYGQNVVLPGEPATSTYKAKIPSKPSSGISPNIPSKRFELAYGESKSGFQFQDRKLYWLDRVMDFQNIEERSIFHIVPSPTREYISILHYDIDYAGTKLIVVSSKDGSKVTEIVRGNSGAAMGKKIEWDKNGKFAAISVLGGGQEGIYLIDIKRQKAGFLGLKDLTRNRCEIQSIKNDYSFSKEGKLSFHLAIELNPWWDAPGENLRCNENATYPIYLVEVDLKTFRVTYQ